MGKPVTLDLCLRLTGLPRQFQPDHIASSTPASRATRQPGPRAPSSISTLSPQNPLRNPPPSYCKKATAPRLPRPSPDGS